MTDTHMIEAEVNGKRRKLAAPSRKLLSDFIREDLGLTGTHVGCEHGVCGACTILLDGRPVRSCLMFAPQADGARIETIESLAQDGDDLHPVQRAFWEHHGLQCGFCTPGMVLTAKAFLEEVPHPTEAQIRAAISGNVCRCTGYVFIVEAIQAAGKTMADGARTRE
ncbi:MAG TPA: (2Fe-2S)-binding protein [Candidatus Dormibacteraeota bacterium]|jgi:carbon-monoxide dehydrogenase small subunit